VDAVSGVMFPLWEQPIADMAEPLVADYVGVEPEPPNVKAYDVQTKDARRVQVKALRRTKASRKGLSALRSLDFDVVTVVIFERDMTLAEIAWCRRPRYGSTWAGPALGRSIASA
jgi:hypothetical protein